MSESQPKPLRVQPEREFYTPKPKQSRVIARHLNGESNRKIAREEGIDRETVSRILSQEELVIMVAKQQSRLLRLAAKALDVYEEALDSNDLVLAVATATKILEGADVMGKGGLQGTIDDASKRHSAGSLQRLTGFDLDPFEWPPNELAPPLESKRPRRKSAQASIAEPNGRFRLR